jgi:tetratricopeptide (TPR) repeat protein
LDVINNNILDKNILYYVGNLDSQQAKSIILSLSQRSRLAIESQLVDKLVRDLAHESREVRPIKLQVVGAQLQSDGITTLEQYLELGSHPKETLVQRYLQGVVTDCGDEQQRAAELVLYLLTDEHDTRPLRTRAELEEDLQELAMGLTAEASKLDLVLRIFVESGLVFLLKESPADRYQLVHDYLVTFIRQQQEPKIKELVAELEIERQQRQYAEVLRQQAETELQQTEAAKKQVERERAEAEAERDRAQKETQIAAEQLKQTKVKRDRAERDRRIAALKTKRQIRMGAAVLMCSIVLAGGSWIWALIQGQAATIAQEQLEQATEAFEEMQNITVGVGWIPAESGNLEKTLNIFNNVLDLNPNSVVARAARGEVYRLMEDYNHALTDLNFAIELDSEYTLALGSRGETYRKLERYSEALNDFNRAIEINPNYTFALGSRGQVYLALKRDNEALEDFQHALELDPTLGWVIDELLQMGNPQAALDTLDRVLDSHPDSSLALAGRGEIHRQMGRFPEALDDFNRAIELQSDYLWAIVSRGQTYQALKQNDEALADFTRALEIDPQSLLALDERGRQYHLMGRYPEALEDFNRMIELNPENDWFLYDRSLVYLSAGDLEKSNADLTAAIQLAQPNYRSNPQIAYDWRNTVNLAIYYLASGDLDRSEKLYREVLDLGIPNYILREAIHDLENFLLLFPDHSQAQSMLELLQSHLE